jgi:hypothetical protein
MKASLGEEIKLQSFKLQHLHPKEKKVQGKY